MEKKIWPKFLMPALIAGCILLSGCAWGGGEGKIDESAQGKGSEEISAEEQALGEEEEAGEGQALTEAQAAEEGWAAEERQAEEGGQSTKFQGADGDFGSGEWPENIIKEQCFEVELDGWGKVTFVSASPVSGKGEAEFFLFKDGKKVYTFPGSRTPQPDEFVEVRAVSFTDYNKDGKKDVIVLASYRNGGSTRSVAEIFLQENADNMFYMDYPDIESYRVEAKSEAGPSFYRDGFLEEYLSAQQYADKISDISGTWTSYMDYVGRLNGFWDTEGQLELLAANRDKWMADVDYANDRYCFTIRDMDYDGQLAVIVANQGGTGNYTYSKFYELDREGNLNELETSFMEGDSQPDIIMDEMTVYNEFSAEGMRDYYIVYDDIKLSPDTYMLRVSSLSVQDDFVLETPLASKTTVYGENGSVISVVSVDCNGNTLTEEEFEDFPETYYGNMGCSRRIEDFFWMDVGSLAGKSDEEIVELLRRVYERRDG